MDVGVSAMAAATELDVNAAANAAADDEVLFEVVTTAGEGSLVVVVVITAGGSLLEDRWSAIRSRSNDFLLCLLLRRCELKLA